MKNEKFTQYYNGTNLSMKRKKNEEVLELSPTGYGLEPVNEIESDSKEEPQ